MPDKLIKSPSLPSGRAAENIGVHETPGAEVAETSKIVIEGLNVLPENAEEGGQYNEKKESDRSQNGGSAVSGVRPGDTQVSVLPPIEEMIRQTEQAIEMEMRQTEVEMRSLLRNSKSSAYDINDKVKKIRFLKNLLNELKKAARMAEDYIVNLWKQYVRKIS